MNSAIPGDITFRQALPRESAALSRLAIRSKGYWGYSAAFLLACKQELTYSPTQIAKFPAFVVAELRGKVAGFYALDHVSDGEVELEALFVEPVHIGSGIGRALMDHAKATARSLGAETLLVQGDPHAEQFYRRAAAELVGTRESASIPGRLLPLFRVPLVATNGTVKR